MKTSIDTVRAGIEKKISPIPNMASGKTIKPVITDMDHHPYTRWYRGVYYYPDPIIMEREAGYRPLRNDCYDVNIPEQKEIEPSHCFQVPCSTTFPCYPKYLAKYSDKETLDVMINNACIPQYR